MYAEDLDLCRRIGEVSKTMFYPMVAVYHEYEKAHTRIVNYLNITSAL